ncbi:Ku protein [Streptomyces sp. NRRL F-5123]|uniref:non-homologous end joining protein Ku n=1 Tax=Streptomyces sp. NRRL F-5123 TaxID=1463856 RepID=UPI0004E10F37|nr:Ku protein [Streptomyces sp. NRRL F-5123]
MRSVWSGTLAFGLVSIPVKLGSAVSSHKISFRQIHLADQGRVRYQKTCELDEEVLSSAEIGRAFETPDDQLVEVSDAELQSLPLPTAKTIEVSGFVDTSRIDRMQLDTPYFLAPSSPTANKPYVLMREALSRSGKAAVGKFAMRNSEHLALITARDDILLLQTLRWPDELNSAADAAPRGKVNISDNELKLADTLIEALGEADLTAYHDEYAAAVEALVTAKLEGAELPTVEGETGGGKVVDLMAALQASVDQAHEGRTGGGKGGGGEKDATVTDIGGRSAKGGGTGKRPAKKAAAKKTAAKKTAKKAPAKKTASRRKAN